MRAAPRDCAVSIRTRVLRYLLRGGRVARPYTNRTRSARETRRPSRAPTRLSGSRPPARRPVVTYRHSAITSLRATATIPIRRARLPCPKVRLIPLREGALRLPAHPIPGELNADRLQPRIARATDPLLPRRLAAVVRRRRKAQEPADLPPIAERPPHQALVEQHRRARRRDALQLHQLAQRTRRRRGGHGRLLLRLELRDLRLEHRAAAPPRARAALARRPGSAAPAQSRTRRPPTRRAGAPAAAPPTSPASRASD